MQIILQEDVEKLGNRGEVVEVAAGYARNYLLPKKLAMEATPGTPSSACAPLSPNAKPTTAPPRKLSPSHASERLALAHPQSRRERSALRLGNHRRHLRSSRSPRLQNRQAQNPARRPDQAGRRISGPSKAAPRHSSQRKARGNQRSVGAGVHHRPVLALGFSPASRFCVCSALASAPSASLRFRRPSGRTLSS